MLPCFLLSTLTLLPCTASADAGGTNGEEATADAGEPMQDGREQAEPTSLVAATTVARAAQADDRAALADAAVVPASDEAALEELPGTPGAAEAVSRAGHSPDALPPSTRPSTPGQAADKAT